VLIINVTRNWLQSFTWYVVIVNSIRLKYTVIPYHSGRDGL